MGREHEVARRWPEIADYSNEPQDERNWLFSVTDGLKALLQDFGAFMRTHGIKPLPLVTTKSWGRKNFWDGYEEVTTITPVGYGGWYLHMIPDADKFAVTEKSELVIARPATRADFRNASAKFYMYRYRYFPGMVSSDRDYYNGTTIYKPVSLTPDFRQIRVIHEMLVLNPGEKHQSIAGPAAGCPPGAMPPPQGPLAPGSALFQERYAGDETGDFFKTITVSQALMQEMEQVAKQNQTGNQRKQGWFSK